jgi:hypothetical protein
VKYKKYLKSMEEIFFYYIKCIKCICSVFSDHLGLVPSAIRSILRGDLRGYLRGLRGDKNVRCDKCVSNFGCGHGHGLRVICDKNGESIDDIDIRLGLGLRGLQGLRGLRGNNCEVRSNSASASKFPFLVFIFSHSRAHLYIVDNDHFNHFNRFNRSTNNHFEIITNNSLHIIAKDIDLLGRPVDGLRGPFYLKIHIYKLFDLQNSYELCTEEIFFNYIACICKNLEKLEPFKNLENLEPFKNLENLELFENLEPFKDLESFENLKVHIYKHLDLKNCFNFSNDSNNKCFGLQDLRGVLRVLFDLLSKPIDKLFDLQNSYEFCSEEIDPLEISFLTFSVKLSLLYSFNSLSLPLS